MRRVQFDLINGAYPDDMAHFESTKLHKSIDKWVGQYSGSDPTIEDYTGPWPIITEWPPVDTLPWMRNDLGETAEFASRAYAAVSTNNKAIDVGVFLDAIRDRMTDVIITSDSQYEAGVNLLYEVGIIDESKAIHLLSLGGHTLPT